MAATAPQAALAKWGEGMNWSSSTLQLPFVAGEEEEEGRVRKRKEEEEEDGPKRMDALSVKRRKMVGPR